MSTVTLDLGNDGPIFLAANLRAMADQQEEGGWESTAAALRGLAKQAEAARPLVVIDPEDREQVERLLSLLKSQDRAPEMTDIMQAALREFASPTPPKPDEPMGLGAVVVDAAGERWVRSEESFVPWYCGGLPEGGVFREWAQIAAVCVIAEGVQP